MAKNEDGSLHVVIRGENGSVLCEFEFTDMRQMNSMLDSVDLGSPQIYKVKRLRVFYKSVILEGGM